MVTASNRPSVVQFARAVQALSFADRKAFLAPVIELGLIELPGMAGFVMAMFLEAGPHGGVPEGIERLADHDPRHIDDLTLDAVEAMLHGAPADKVSVCGWSQDQFDTLRSKLAGSRQPEVA